MIGTRIRQEQEQSSQGADLFTMLVYLHNKYDFIGLFGALPHSAAALPHPEESGGCRPPLNAKALRLVGVPAPRPFVPGPHPRISTVIVIG